MSRQKLAHLMLSLGVFIVGIGLLKAYYGGSEPLGPSILRAPTHVRAIVKNQRPPSQLAKKSPIVKVRGKVCNGNSPAVDGVVRLHCSAKSVTTIR